MAHFSNSSGFHAAAGAADAYGVGGFGGAGTMDAGATSGASARERAKRKGSDRAATRRKAKGKVAMASSGGFFKRRARTKDAQDGASSSRKRSRTSALLKYAQDNAAVRAVNTITTGPLKPLFILVVIAAVGFGLYFPVRDLYIAYRSQVLIEEQIAIREAYNEALEEEVEQLLSEEGVQDAARKELGMVMEGETVLIVTGLDEDGNPIVETEDSASTDADSSEEDENEDTASSTPSTTIEVEAAEAAVYENSAWYWQLLDSFFFFDGTTGQAVVSTGE